MTETQIPSSLEEYCQNNGSYEKEFLGLKSLISAICKNLLSQKFGVCIQLIHTIGKKFINDKQTHILFKIIREDITLPESMSIAASKYAPVDSVRERITEGQVGKTKKSFKKTKKSSDVPTTNSNILEELFDNYLKSKKSEDKGIILEKLIDEYFKTKDIGVTNIDRSNQEDSQLFFTCKCVIPIFSDMKFGISVVYSKNVNENQIERFVDKFYKTSSVGFLIANQNIGEKIQDIIKEKNKKRKCFIGTTTFDKLKDALVANDCPVTFLQRSLIDMK